MPQLETIRYDKNAPAAATIHPGNPESRVVDINLATNYYRNNTAVVHAVTNIQVKLWKLLWGDGLSGKDVFVYNGFTAPAASGLPQTPSKSRPPWRGGGGGRRPGHRHATAAAVDLWADLNSCLNLLKKMDDTARDALNCCFADEDYNAIEVMVTMLPRIGGWTSVEEFHHKLTQHVLEDDEDGLSKEQLNRIGQLLKDPESGKITYERLDKLIQNHELVKKSLHTEAPVQDVVATSTRRDRDDSPDAVSQPSSPVSLEESEGQAANARELEASSSAPPVDLIKNFRPVHLGYSAALAAKEQGGWFGSDVPPEANAKLQALQATLAAKETAVAGELGDTNIPTKFTEDELTGIGGGGNGVTSIRKYSKSRKATRRKSSKRKSSKRKKSKRKK